MFDDGYRLESPFLGKKAKHGDLGARELRDVIEDDDVILFISEAPNSAGISSSAAFEVVFAYAVSEMNGCGLDKKDVALGPRPQVYPVTATVARLKRCSARLRVLNTVTGCGSCPEP